MSRAHLRAPRLRRSASSTLALLWLVASAVGLVADPAASEAVEAAEPPEALRDYSPIDIDAVPLHPSYAALMRDLETRVPGASKPYGPEMPGVVTRGTLARGTSLGAALRSQGIEPDVAHLLSREMRPVFDFRRSQPGDHYRLTQHPDGSVIEFRYWTGSDRNLVLTRVGDRYEVREEEADLEARVVRIAGVISSSLYDAVRALGEQPRLANDIANLFAWDIDFSRGVQPGDDFQVLYERLYRKGDEGEGGYVRPGRILAARYRGQAGQVEAFYYEDASGKSGYYRADGSSLEREFLAAPLEYSRITSSFSSSRRHPILKVTRPHHGIDYAAPAGTPTWAVANGEVIFRGWGGSFGNLVKVRHANGYVSYYSHLAGFAKGLRVGQLVTQKQVIGYVGQTGLATGPHVCFRVTHEGRYVHPAKVESPAGRPIPDEKWIDFQLVRDLRLAHLEAGTLVSTEEAL